MAGEDGRDDSASRVNNPDEQLRQEIRSRYPGVYEEFSSRISEFISVLGQYESRQREIHHHDTLRPDIIPPENRDQVLAGITQGFERFVFNTRAASIRQAESKTYPGERDKKVAIARAIGAFRASMVIPGETGGRVPDVVLNLKDELMLIVNRPGSSGLPLEELYFHAPLSSSAHRSLDKLSPEDQAIRVVGLLLAARLTPNVSASIGTLPKTTPGIVKTTVEGNPADVATDILVKAGAKPY